jgi:hypothetical protein
MKVAVPSGRVGSDPFESSWSDPLLLGSIGLPRFRLGEEVRLFIKSLRKRNERSATQRPHYGLEG